MRTLFAAAMLATTISLMAQPATLPANVVFVEKYGGISQYRLKSNDMPILLMQDRTAPVITFMVVYHVGSRNEAPGHTGSAHLLEHMIFNKSTENFGKANGHKTFQEVLYEAGADFGSTNMTTWLDRMNGYSTLPSDKLELAIRIEADRLGRGLILDSERSSEMSVVRNEYEIGQNNPYEALGDAVIGAAIVAHPYRWSTIGYRSDIEGVTTEKLREHYKNFFHPNNAEAILVGDFDESEALAIFDKQFGAYPRSTRPIPQVITEEPPQEGERRVIVKRPSALRIVQLAYMRPGALHPDFLPIEVLSAILGGGLSSRLYKQLVETGLATDPFSDNYALKDPYPIVFTATVAEGSDHQKVEDAIKKSLYSAGSDGVTEAEVRKAQEQIEVAVARSRDGSYAFTSNLGEAVASASWKWFVDYLDGIRKVTPAEVQRVAAKYLVPDHATVGWFLPLDTSAKTVAPVAAAMLAPAPVVKPTAAAAAQRPARTTKPVARGASTFAQRTVRKVLANGLIVDIVENHAVPTVAVRALILAGDSAAPVSKPAVAMMTASMVQRGTTTRTKQQIAEALESRGANLTIGTNLFETSINGTGMSRDAGLILEILADELLRPSFPEDELVKSKVEIRNNILRAGENTSARATDRLSQLVLPAGHPYRAPGYLAMEASVDNVTAADIRAFHRDRYRAGAMILAVVGDVDAAKVISLVERLFGGMPAGGRIAPVAVAPVETAATSEVVNMPGKANMNILLGMASGLRRNDPDFEAALIANAALGQNSLSSRIGKRVRDTEGLSYNLSSRFFMTDLADGMFLVNVNVAPMNLQKALRSTREEIVKYVKEGATDDEVAVGKSFFAGNYKVGLGNNGGIAAALVTAEKYGYGPKYLDEYPERIRRVTREDVNRVLKARIRPDRLTLVVAGDIEKPPAE